MCISKRWPVLVCLLAMAVSACAPAATPTPIVVEKEKIVKETQVVLVTPTPVPPTPIPALPDEIRIGVYMPMTGGTAAFGEMQWKAIEFAATQRPSVLGRPVKLILEDNRSDKSDAALAVARLIEVDNAHAIIGTPSSSLAIAGGEVSEKAGMPVLGTTCTNPLVTQGRKYYFRICYVDTFQGPVMARYAVNNLGAKTVAIITDISNDGPMGAAIYFREEFIKLTGDPMSVLAMLSIQSGERDFSAQLNTIKAMDPDVVFVPSMYAEGAALCGQAFKLGLLPDTPILGQDSWDVPAMLEIAGAQAMEGVAFSTMYHPDAFTHALAQQFNTDWKQLTGEFPGKDASGAYDAYYCMLDAIERAGSVDPEAITKALSETKDFMGVTGSITMDADHNARKACPIVGFRNGQKVLLDIVQPW